MAVTEEIAWGDGSGDKIYLTANALEGNQTVSVSSDANAGYTDRTKVVTFSASGVSPVSLTVTQSSKNIIIITRNDTAMAENDVAVGYEQ